MERKLKYRIEETNDGKSIGTFLKEKEYSRGVLIELKKTKIGIRKNGIWAGVNEVLHIGDTLDICLVGESASGNIIPIKGSLDILFEDEDLLIVNKAYDTPIHPSVNNYDNTLANYIAYYFQEKNKSYVFRCINRLDRDTTGVTIIAKNLLSAGILSNRVKERQLSRVYMAFVEGITEEKGVIDLPIGRMEDSIIKRKIDKENGKHAITYYQRLDTFYIEEKPVSVIALKLETGRTHQIRVHMSAIGHPLLGDFLYNESNQMLTRQGLHGVMCAFQHPITGEHLQIMAPLPQDMQALSQEGFKENNKQSKWLSELKILKW